MLVFQCTYNQHIIFSSNKQLLKYSKKVLPTAMNYLQQLMSFVETVPKNPEHISQLKFNKKRLDLESYQTLMLKAVANIKLQPMLYPTKYYFLIKLHNLERNQTKSILMLLKCQKAADCSICIYVSVPQDVPFLSRHNFVTCEGWCLVLFLKHISMVFFKKIPFIQPGYQ